VAPREVSLDSGTSIQLTSLRTRRKVQCISEKLMGLGGLAKVYGGRLEDGTQVVLKVQRFEGRGADHSLEVEIELFKKLFHRNIVHCVGVGVSPAGLLIIAFRRAYQNPLLMMSKGSDESRRDKRAKYPVLPLDTAVDLGYELLNSLAYLERLGFVHHDVKLANLLIDVASKDRSLEEHEIFNRVLRRNYRAVLIDFGATRSRNYLDAWNRGEALEGLAPQITPFYAPPEAVVESRRPNGELGLTFHHSIDVYAAALLIYSVITGHPPYSHLKTPPNHHDMETVIAAKSAERRGEIEPISAEILRRVVYEDTKFLSGDRAAFDEALYRFMSKRLAPEPEERGSAAEMKRDLERLALIRGRRADQDARGVAGSRVFLPFRQELVVVGGAGEHPLVRAARACGVDTRRPDKGHESGRPRSLSDSSIQREGDTTSGRRESSSSSRRAPRDPNEALRPPSDRPPSERFRRRPPSDRHSSPEGERPPGTERFRTQRPSSGRYREEEAPSESGDDPLGFLSDMDATVIDEEPDRTPGPGRRPPPPRRRRPPPPPPQSTPPPADREVWGRSTSSHIDREELLRRAGRRRSRRRGKPKPPPRGDSTSAPRPPSGPHDRSVSGRRPRPAAKEGRGEGGKIKRKTSSRHERNLKRSDPLGRGYPAAEQANSNHCLLSPVLDAPLLLSRERTYHIGRDPAVDVRIKSDLVSRRHAEIAWDGQAFVLTDLGSLNGTSLNGHKMQAPAPLHDEDRIGFGGFEFVVRVLSGQEWKVDEQGGTARILKGQEDWSRSAQQSSFHGDLTRLSLRDVLEIVDWKRHSGRLDLTEAEDKIGTLWFETGRLVHAECGAGEGLDAAVELLTLRRGQFHFEHGNPKVNRTIDASLDEVWAELKSRLG
jgi:pSer/pThr/pTyr-binding forkhead associated (FHA) protein/serine/threonine protein kinase